MTSQTSPQDTTENTPQRSTQETNGAAAVVAQYIAAWNETDATVRRVLVREVFADDAAYADPMFAARGHDEVDAMIAGVHVAYPGCRFVATGTPAEHHDRLLWHWDLVQPDGVTPVAHGLDVAVLAADGRLADVTGFFDAA
jgi:hypothetical protein